MQSIKLLSFPGQTACTNNALKRQINIGYHLSSDSRFVLQEFARDFPGGKEEFISVIEAAAVIAAANLKRRDFQSSRKEPVDFNIDLARDTSLVLELKFDGKNTLIVTNVWIYVDDGPEECFPPALKVIK